MHVLLVTTWGIACGIAEHSAMLKEAVETSDPEIRVDPCPEALDPFHDRVRSAAGIDLVHLNHQDALHSRWTVERIRDLQRVGYKVLVTYHDSGVPNKDHCKAIVAAADAAVVHEPFDDLPPDKTRYWRMGVPEGRGAYQFGVQTRRGHAEGWLFKRFDSQPVLGSIGFPFPWKCYDQLAEITGLTGWGLVLIAPGATDEQIEHWRSLNPCLMVQRAFVPRGMALQILAGCDATAFTHVCHNTGQSGSLAMGIAARKPVLALSTCRQFRALLQDPLGREAIHWIETFEELPYELRHLAMGKCDPAVVALAEQESWRGLGAKYARLYKELAG